VITSVGDVRLRTGETMAIKIVEPPQDDYAERLCHFLEHKSDNSFRGIRQRLYGKYVQHCIDRYFVGEIGGQIVGQVWYGLPRSGTGVGNFGHVYTEPAHRKKGISTELVRVVADDFLRAGNGTCLLCSAGEVAAKIYARFGFEFIVPGATSGPMALINKRAASDFADLDEAYFEAGLEVKVREGHIGDRHDCDRMLDFSRGMNELRKRWHMAFVSRQVPSFMDALFCVEDGKGIVTVIESSKGSILGYAFVLNLGSESEGDLKVMDFVVHPNYLVRAEFFVEETVKIAKKAGVIEMYAFAASCDEDKVAALRGAGFGEEYRFPNKFKSRGRLYDIAVLHSV